jgi:hypothetical protein
MTMIFEEILKNYTQLKKKGEKNFYLRILNLQKYYFKKFNKFISKNIKNHNFYKF